MKKNVRRRAAATVGSCQGRKVMNFAGEPHPLETASNHLLLPQREGGEEGRFERPTYT